jgi:hypothetical protein
MAETYKCAARETGRQSRQLAYCVFDGPGNVGQKPVRQLGTNLFTSVFVPIRYPAIDRPTNDCGGCRIKHIVGVAATCAELRRSATPKRKPQACPLFLAAPKDWQPEKATQAFLFTDRSPPNRFVNRPFEDRPDTEQLVVRLCGQFSQCARTSGENRESEVAFQLRLEAPDEGPAFGISRHRPEARRQIARPIRSGRMLFRGAPSSHQYPP